MGAALIHADRQMERHNRGNSFFCKYVNEPKNLRLFADMFFVDGKFAELQIFDTRGELKHF